MRPGQDVKIKRRVYVLGSAPIRSEVLWPAPRSMQYTQDFEVLSEHTIGNNVRQFADNQFACSHHAPGAANCRMCRQQVFDLIDQLQNDAGCCRRIVLADVGRDLVEVALSEPCPTQPQVSFPILT